MQHACRPCLPVCAQTPSLPFCVAPMCRVQAWGVGLCWEPQLPACRTLFRDCGRAGKQAACLFCPRREQPYCALGFSGSAALPALPQTIGLPAQPLAGPAFGSYSNPGDGKAGEGWPTPPFLHCLPSLLSHAKLPATVPVASHAKCP